mmetsp:Transcript_36320/g.72904  ORF Transcript_36320/g.72904 Transcript_36320/m.72904 type:complete len:252 (-) Transcript_36320:59-814(-)
MVIRPRHEKLFAPPSCSSEQALSFVDGDVLCGAEGVHADASARVVVDKHKALLQEMDELAPVLARHHNSSAFRRARPRAERETCRRNQCGLERVRLHLLQQTRSVPAVHVHEEARRADLLDVSLLKRTKLEPAFAFVQELNHHSSVPIPQVSHIRALVERPRVTNRHVILLGPNSFRLNRAGSVGPRALGAIIFSFLFCLACLGILLLCLHCLILLRPLCPNLSHLRCSIAHSTPKPHWLSVRGQERRSLE